MAVKTITIDLEAYRRLKARKGRGESFSQTIKRVVPAPMDVDEFLRRIEEWPMCKEAIEAVEEQIRSRHRPSTRAR